MKKKKKKTKKKRRKKRYTPSPSPIPKPSQIQIQGSLLAPPPMAYLPEQKPPQVKALAEVTLPEGSFLGEELQYMMKKLETFLDLLNPKPQPYLRALILFLLD